MNRFFVIWIAALTFINTSLFAAAPSSIQIELRQNLQTYVEQQKIPQVIVGVEIGNQKPIFVTNRKASLDTPYFPIASITKTFTAALILKLAQEGILKLDNTVGQYLPNYPHWKDITLRQLLNQTSGIPDYIHTPGFFENMRPQHLYSAKELLSLASSLPEPFAPGKGWAYSNTNYLLLGVIAEKATRKPLEALYSQFLFRPLKLANTLYSAGYYPKSVEAHMMPGYFNTYLATPSNMTWAQGAGAIVSTVPDLLQWAKAIYTNLEPNYFKTIQHNRVLLSNGQPSQNKHKATYGMGVFALNTPYGIMWFTPGLDSGYRNILAYFPCQSVWIVASINRGDTPMSATTALLTTILKALKNNLKTKQQIDEAQLAQSLPEYCRIPAAKDFDF